VTTVLWILVALALVQGAISLRDGVRNARFVLQYPDPPPATSGRVLLLCPAKGEDPNLTANARSLLAQDYPDYRVVFLVDDPADPAALTLSGIEGATLEVGGRSPDRGQKVHNLLHGVARFGDTADVWVFADADASFPSGWLRRLVAPLGEAGVGATTGYRWYVPPAGEGASLLRSAWNATVAGFLGPHRQNFAWGGSMAIRREVFREARIGALWAHAVSDDYALTHGVRRHGMRVAWVPTCLVPAYEGCSWPELVEFTTRQIRITRVYAPAIWRMGFASYTLFNVTFWWTTVASLTGRWEFAPAWVAIYLLTVVRSEVRLRGVGRAITDESLRRYRWFYRLSTPLVSLVYQLNFVLSAFSRRIVWKDVVYTMVSPEETRVEFLDSPDR